ncbi:hypothetical protein EDD29_5186 [Actinocorallia herbida]|uniref:DUF6603 domain-containing protein n=1 Tax=Actinocorallia herbida TaxID=58109 RepID=A0A3N1D218_9ACTN|nr:DUF6603 domain-containing protein [Actinocorallia herbida]ROO87573.1 hypothetical protein EDD29_5186 [Actinocorallia herbida]
MSLAEELAALVAPLIDALAGPDGADALLRELGVVTAPAAPPAVPEQLAALATTAQTTVDALLALDDETVPAAERTAGLVTNLAALADAFADLADLDESAVADLAAPFDAPALWSFLADALPGYLLTRWLRDRHGTAYELMRLVGVVSAADGAPPGFDLDRLAAALSDAAPWAEALADPGALAGPLRRRLDAGGVTAAPPAWPVGGPEGEAEAEAPAPGGERVTLSLPGSRPGVLGLTGAFEAVDTVDGPGLAITVEGLDRVPGGIDLGGGWSVAADGGPGPGGAVLGAGWAEPLDGEAALDSAAVELAGRPPVPWALIGEPGATRVELAALTLGLGGDSLISAPSVVFEAGTDGLRLVIVPGDGDSFLASLLGGDIVVELALSGRWSSADGLGIDGAAGLTVRIATSITLGPLTISGLTIALSVGGGVIALVFTTEIGGHVGPLSASVHGMGLRVELLDGDAGGPGTIRLGPVGLAFGFEPPDGACLNLELETVKGGGCLFFDREPGRYAGVIELEMLGVGICAIVIIDTEALPSGEWSMFFALFIDLPAIQLGFGFALTGVGGLAGINRDLDSDALAAAVRSGGMDTVLFPANPVEDAPQVIAELSAIFPAEQDRHVFGPVVRLAWGTPPLIEAELGIVLSLPDPITIGLIGSVTSILPSADTDLVALNLDIGGGIDAAAGTLWIDAELHDSHIVFFALTGGMAVRSGFAGRPSFLMALGGFHPGFDAPDDFPALAPLSLAISAAPVLDIGFSCYLAITSNSVQFGSTFHLSAQVAGFGVEGGASFDALVEFSPFLLSTRLGWYVVVRAAGVDLAGVWLEASVEGPNPWLVVGTASFKFLGFEEHVRIDERIGSRQPESAVAPVELLEELTAALATEAAWSTVAGTSPGVVVAGTEPRPDELVVLPDGVVTVAQRVVPLGVRLDKAGDAPLGVHDTFTVEPGAAALTGSGAVHDWFAPGYFFELAAGDRLSSPSFERLQAGIEFGGGEIVAGTARPGTLEFEEILRDPELGEDRVDLGVVDMAGDVRSGVLTMTADGDATRGGFQIAADPEQATIQGPAYAVVHRDTGAVQGRAATWSAAHQSEVGRRTSTVVVPSWEAPP